MQKVFDSSDVVMLTETWTNDFSNIEVNNFESFVLNRKKKRKKKKKKKKEKKQAKFGRYYFIFKK